MAHINGFYDEFEGELSVRCNHNKTTEGMTRTLESRRCYSVVMVSRKLGRHGARCAAPRIEFLVVLSRVVVKSGFPLLIEGHISTARCFFELVRAL